MKKILLISFCLMIALTFSITGCKSTDDSSTGDGTGDGTGGGVPAMDNYKCSMDGCGKMKEVAAGAAPPT